MGKKDKKKDKKKSDKSIASAINNTTAKVKKKSK